MSSILDALRKLEEEKAEYPAAPQTPRPIEPITREPAPRRSRSRRPSRSAKRSQDQSRKLWIGVPVAIFAVGIIWAAATNMPQSDSAVDVQEPVATANTAPAETAAEPNPATGAVRSDTTLARIEADLRLVAAEPLRESKVSIPETNLTTPIRSAEPEPVQPEPATLAAIPESPRIEIREPRASMNSESRIPAATIASIQVEVSPVPMEVKPPVEFVPEPVQMARVENEIIKQERDTYEEEIAFPPTEPSERYREAMAMSNALRDGTQLEEEPKPRIEKDIRRYDIMTRTVRARFGIPELDINMLMQPNDRHPRPSALINYNNVYVGETIPDTKGRVHLIGVDIRGIAVEVDGERFYYPK